MNNIHVNGIQLLTYTQKLYITKYIPKIINITKIYKNIINITFVTNPQIKQLNVKFKKKNKYTDVLTFCINDTSARLGYNNILGEIIISINEASRQAKQNKHNVEIEILKLIIHGIFHLLGLNHKKNNKEKKIQFKYENKIINHYNITNTNIFK